jgi:hypothetical protein
MIPQIVVDLAKAIAHAEGFGVPNTVPTRAHNPGDLKIPNWNGATTGTEGITVFIDDETGWNALYQQLLRMMDNQSHIYKLSDTFSQFSGHWTDTQEGMWLDNVLHKLQELGYTVSKDTTLGAYFQGAV